MCSVCCVLQYLVSLCAERLPTELFNLNILVCLCGCLRFLLTLYFFRTVGLTVIFRNQIAFVFARCVKALGVPFDPGGYGVFTLSFSKDPNVAPMSLAEA